MFIQPARGKEVIFRLVSHLAWREIDGETCVVDLKRKTMYGLNPSASRVWQSLETGQPVTGPGAPDAPVGRFLDELEALGLVTRDDSAAGAAAELPEATADLDPAMPPQILWQEEIRSFGQSCQLVPGNDQCDAGGPQGPP